MGVTMSGQVYPAKKAATGSEPLLVQDFHEGRVVELSPGAPNQGYGSLFRPSIKPDLVCFNVGGKKFFAMKKNFTPYPDTRIGTLLRATSTEEILENCDDYQAGEIPEYFFDKSWKGFNDILDVYRVGHLHLNSGGLCAMRIKAMIDYWRLDELLLDPCCAMKYYNDIKTCVMEIDDHMDTTQRFKKTLESEDFGTSLPCRVRKFLWNFTEYPESSQYAKAFSILSTSILIGSIINLIVTSSVRQLIPESETSNATGPVNPEEKWVNGIIALRIIDHIFNWFFIIEYLVRFICSPRKLLFAFKALNLVDFLAIFPYFLGIIIGDLVNTSTLARLGKALRLVRIIRILRVFKFIRHFPALQSLISTLFHTGAELVLLLFMIFLTASICGSLLYFSEQESEKQWMFVDSVWWILSNLSTTGGGDRKPSSVPGEILGVLCLLIGVVIVTLPMPIIWTSYAVKYKQVVMTNQMKAMKKERKEIGRKTSIIENHDVTKQQTDTEDIIENNKPDTENSVIHISKPSLSQMRQDLLHNA